MSNANFKNRSKKQKKLHLIEALDDILFLSQVCYDFINVLEEIQGLPKICNFRFSNQQYENYKFQELLVKNRKIYSNDSKFTF